MTRIIAGSERGRRLAVPAHGTRPTTDRVRESMFSTLTSILLGAGLSWADLQVLDLYAGSGALGLEAASRGAERVILVEKTHTCAEVIRANIAAVGLDGVALVQTTVEALSQRSASHAHELVFADPPYDVTVERLAKNLAALVEAGWIAKDACVVVERPAHDRQPPFPQSWYEFDQRRYGDTVLWYGRPTATSGE
ncbi:MAG: 16S rRNA (guanine(966)-N(2))-methyltransferase RsmD [Actinomycetota bacterium]|nr:16S rRNA (guanine(966)-N(2))-methyltransferase RsmD [Actinomycetota bacterium]MDP2288359.1 16S rRNA (guanine(966)-N(2))-methyltransferase RsmD [Actinomycetota bacterium]